MLQFAKHLWQGLSETTYFCDLRESGGSNKNNFTLIFVVLNYFSDLETKKFILIENFGNKSLFRISKIRHFQKVKIWAWKRN